MGRHRLLRRCDDFTRDCIARALTTLPYATVDGDSIAINTIRTIVLAGHCDDSQYRRMVDILSLEGDAHAMAGNMGKADIIRTFRDNLMRLFTSAR